MRIKYMKIMHNIALSITFTLAIQSNATFAMQNIALKAAKMGISSLCSGFELICALNPIWTTYFIHHPRIVAKKTKEYHSNAPESIINFVQQLKEKRNIKQVIHVVIKENGHRNY